MAKLIGSARLDNALRIVSDISEGGQATTVTFDNYNIHLNHKNKGPLTVEKVATVTFAVENEESEVGITTVLSGYINVTGSGKATLIAHICGTTYIGKLPKISSEGKDFNCCFNSKLDANNDYRAVIILLAERNSQAVEANINLSLDSMDLEITKTTKTV